MQGLKLVTLGKQALLIFNHWQWAAHGVAILGLLYLSRFFGGFEASEFEKQKRG